MQTDHRELMSRAEYDARALAGTLDLDIIDDMLPSDIGPHDLLFIHMLNPTQKQQVLRRLYALLRNGEDLSVAQASRLADVMTPNFYRLRRLWANRSTSGLGFLSGYAARTPRKARSYDNSVRPRNVQHIANFPLKDVCKLIQKSKASRLPAHILNNQARHLRQEVRDIPATLRQMYGAKVLIDYSAVSIVVLDQDEEVKLVEVAWVIEEASQLILAAQPALHASPCGAHHDAIRKAAEFIGNHRLDVRKEYPAQIKAIIPAPSSPEDQRYVETLTSTLPKDSVATVGARRFGQFILDVIGPVLGRIKIIPRATQTKDISAAQVRAFGRTPLYEVSAYHLLDDAIDAHNGPIIEKLRNSDLPFCTTNDERGGMVSGLAAVLGSVT